VGDGGGVAGVFCESEKDVRERGGRKKKKIKIEVLGLGKGLDFFFFFNK
jgi:hypothetical protein